jgi:hypothetical protein
MPTTTPATMPAVLLPPPLEADSVGVWVTMRVFWGSDDSVGDAVLVAAVLLLVLSP